MRFKACITALQHAGACPPGTGVAHVSFCGASLSTDQKTSDGEQRCASPSADFQTHPKHSLPLLYETARQRNRPHPLPCGKQQKSLTTPAPRAAGFFPFCDGLRTNRQVDCPLSRKHSRAQNNNPQLHTTSSQRSWRNDGADTVPWVVLSWCTQIMPAAGLRT